MLLNLSLYIILVVVILCSKSKTIPIYACIAFAIFVCLYRDIYAAPDAKPYIEYFSEGIDSLGSSITFKYYRSFLKDVLLLPGLAPYHFTSILPLAIISFISIRSKLLFPIFFYVSSEAYTILSFNAMRQGIGIAILFISIFLIKVNSMKEKGSNNLLIFS